MGNKDIIVPFEVNFLWVWTTL